MRQPIKKDYKIILEYLNTNISLRELELKTGIKKSTIHRWSRDYRNKQNTKNKSNKNQTTTTTPKTKTTMNPKTVNKYENLLTHLEERKRGFKSLAKVLTKFRVSAGTGKILQQEGLVSKDGNGCWKWNGAVGLTHSDLAKSVLSKVNADVMSYAKPRKATKTTSNYPATPKKYVPKAEQNSDVLNLSALRKQKAEFELKIEAIDNLLLLADQLK